MDSAMRFMQALVFKYAPEAGVPLRADGASLQDWNVFAVQQGDGPVAVVIEQRQAR